jgi:hypothetical protein
MFGSLYLFSGHSGILVIEGTKGEGWIEEIHPILPICPSTAKTGGFYSSSL